MHTSGGTTRGAGPRQTAPVAEHGGAGLHTPTPYPFGARSRSRAIELQAGRLTGP
jgi:hypothetical protein